MMQGKANRAAIYGMFGKVKRLFKHPLEATPFIGVPMAWQLKYIILSNFQFVMSPMSPLGFETWSTESKLNHSLVM